ncbi:hypothetical protein Acsp03_70240 [Actinomadura sp. NBRC 104412]|uniref:hypothetical protein n=1 Tax=Actinomadura sp. NBRC 104412 TaxID=3032203 RepID=UPI0024A192ED|nr:hypothetical protein [Actinomadura sp. NBRC 104412]GLZ09558.1 hypothetical protein Acsp03_70240 [Actinomadura sp. NBRC 104412]
MIFAVIVACDIGFWVVLGAGLVARYLLGRRQLGAALLAGVPLIDLILLIASYLDLRAGATAGAEHGLAAVYIGFSVVFGPSTVRWADARFAHRWAGGPPPRRPPKTGKAAVRYEWRQFGKACLTWVITCGLLLAIIVAIDDPDRTGDLWPWIRSMTVMLSVWVIFPIWVTLSPDDDDEDDDAKSDEKSGEKVDAKNGEKGDGKNSGRDQGDGRR